jgi:hypothetical protein
LLEDIRRQTADAVKIFHGSLTPATIRAESRKPPLAWFATGARSHLKIV